MNTTVALRPVHAWFFHWERVVPSLYRVVATGLASLATTLVLILLGFHRVLAAPVSLAAWIGLAVAQDHDQRTRLPPDQAFVAALTDALSAPPLALAIGDAHGPSRARPQRWDTMVVLTPPRAERHPLTGFFMTLERSAAEGWMQLDVGDDAPGRYESIDDRLLERGQSALVRRIHRSGSPEADADAVAAALLAAYW